MYKRILVAIDSDEPSSRVLEEAVKFAKDQQAWVKLLHVMGENISAWQNAGWTGVTDTEEDHATIETVQKFMEGAQQLFRDAGVETEAMMLEKIAVEGLAKVIIEQANQWSADLIIVGTHGRHGFGHLISGSVAEGVIRASPLPVLVVRGIPEG